MRKILIYLLVAPLLILCSCNDDKEQLALVRTADAITTATDPVNKTADVLIGGVVLSDGGVNISERGVLFGETPDPSVKTALGSGIGEYTTTTQIDTDKT